MKGAYAEPPSIAFRKRREVDAAYVASRSRCSPHAAADEVRLGLGTHDVALIDQIAEHASPLGCRRRASRSRCCTASAMDQQRRLAGEGYHVRALIAYGEAWYPWYMRRLAERPANVIVRAAPDIRLREGRRMRVLLIGVGTVGEAIARMAASREWCEGLVLADYDLWRARSLASELEGKVSTQMAVEAIDARDGAAVADLARRQRVDLVMNAVDPRFVMPIFDGAFTAGSTTWTWPTASRDPTRMNPSSSRA